MILAVPLLGLLLLLAQPALDLRWEHHPAHFWLVLITALLSAVLAYATGDAAGRRGDARLLYVSLAFLSSAGFLGLHALSTPGVLLDKPNTGFLIATPVGVAIGSVFAALSTAELLRRPRRSPCAHRQAPAMGAAWPHGLVGRLVSCVAAAA